jgi:hypothetical protein
VGRIGAPLGDLDEALRAEGALRVDVHGLALAAAHVDGQLARHAQRVAQLRLPAAELACSRITPARSDITILFRSMHPLTWTCPRSCQSPHRRSQ